ncbi:MAG: hypothetical protein F6K48_24350 [Okeania sp. SIO3H1]|uniref:hypothetical protein n=1 Tax=Okeania sp. SIO1I7 TaxID=2607772 RepID=UPI0013CAFC8D|nr:hypothetical protein [Okeania sp. SIO1I7]NEN91864.1 hypothetical protein [Okeania sp. SIO3H1]NET26439.1 hypothetical protein [Okeania sp. SIO1I7]
MENNSQSNQKQLTCIEVQESNPMKLIDKFADLAIENKEAGLIIAGACGTSIIIWAISHSAAKLIRAIHR